MILMTVGNSTLNFDMFSLKFSQLGYPIYLIYPLVIARILGLIALWTTYSSKLKEWAYAGFFFEFTLALFAHRAAGDGMFAFPLMAILMLLISYFAEINIQKR